MTLFCRSAHNRFALNIFPMVKRRQTYDDEVEIISTSWSNSNLQVDSLPKSAPIANPKPRPTARKSQSAIPSFASPDPHPFSYPAIAFPASVSVSVLSEPQTQSRPDPSTTLGGSNEAQPPKKKQRTKKKIADPDAPAPEKRGAIFKKACPKNILDRVDRVMSQRYYASPCPFLQNHR